MAVQMEPVRRCKMTAPLQETDKLPPAPAQDAHRLRTKAARGGAASCPRSARVLPPRRGCSMGAQAAGVMPMGMEISTGQIHILGMGSGSRAHPASRSAWAMLKNEDRAIPWEGTRWR